MTQRKFKRFWLIPIGIIGILVLSLIGLFSYTPDTSVPFPYIPPPKSDYIEQTPRQVYDGMLAGYYDPLVAEVSYVGESFIFKNILIDKWILSARHETYVFIDIIQFVPQNPSDLQELKEGDVVDIIGICAGISKEYVGSIVVTNCLFLPAGVAPLPLPGRPAIIGGY